jgi:hypothetical protein
MDTITVCVDMDSITLCMHIAQHKHLKTIVHAGKSHNAYWTAHMHTHGLVDHKMPSTRAVPATGAEVEKPAHLWMWVSTGNVAILRDNQPHQLCEVAHRHGKVIQTLCHNTGIQTPQGNKP